MDYEALPPDGTTPGRRVRPAGASGRLADGSLEESAPAGLVEPAGLAETAEAPAAPAFAAPAPIASKEPAEHWA